MLCVNDNRPMASKTIGRVAPQYVEEAGEALGAFGKRLRAARAARHLTSEVVGTYIGVEGSAVRQWELGHTAITLPNLVAAAEILGQSIDYLLIGGQVDSIDAKVRRIPDALRPALIMRLNDEIEKTAEAAKRLPPELTAGPVVKDKDERLRAWSAKGKPKKMPGGRRK